MAEAVDTPHSIPKGASQEEALAELHRATGWLILAEKTQVDRRCEAPIENAQPEKSIPPLTAAYHLHAMVGANRVVFVRRFWDTKEVLNLPIEEITSIVSGLHELISPLSPHKEDAEITPMEETLYQSLTPQQIAAAQKGQLRLADLTPPQLRSWSTIQSDISFGGPERELARYETLLRNWKSCNLNWIEDAVKRGTLHSLLLDWPADHGPDQLQVYGGLFEAGEPSPSGGLAAQPSVETLPEASKPLTACTAVVGAFPQPISLGDLVQRLGKANGVAVDVPGWSKDRQLFVFASGHTGDEVLQALAIQHGWLLRAAGPKRYVLERPRGAPAKDYLDYFAKVRLLIPPVVRLLTPPRNGLTPSREARRAAEGWRIGTQVLKLKAGYKSMSLTELDANWQRRLANLVLEHHLLSAFRFQLIGQPKPWFATPEQCHFLIDGNPDPAKHPKFLFEYSWQDPDGSRHGEGFGWIVNSQSPAP